MAGEGTEAGTLTGLLSRAAAVGSKPAPVHLWNPPDCGDIPMRIGADGAWHYNGTPIARTRMVRLFASILRREPDGRFVLVTPVEKVGIAVDDAPFQAVEMAVEGGEDDPTLVLRTNVGDVVRAGPEHPIRFAIEEGTGGLIPYVAVRGGLDARLTRALALDLAERIEPAGGDLVVKSGGAHFPVPSSAVEQPQ